MESWGSSDILDDRKMNGGHRISNYSPEYSKRKRIKNKVDGLDTGLSEMEEFGIRWIGRSDGRKRKRNRRNLSIFKPGRDHTTEWRVEGGFLVERGHIFLSKFWSFVFLFYLDVPSLQVNYYFRTNPTKRNHTNKFQTQNISQRKSISSSLCRNADY